MTELTLFCPNCGVQLHIFEDFDIDRKCPVCRTKMSYHKCWEEKDKDFRHTTCSDCENYILLTKKQKCARSLTDKASAF